MNRRFIRQLFFTMLVVVWIIVSCFFFYNNIKKVRITEEKAAKEIFHFILSEFDENIVEIIQSIDGHTLYEYQDSVDKVNNAIKQLCFRELSQDELYYIFGYYIRYYYLNQAGEKEYYYYNFYSNFAINSQTGDIIQERMWSDERC